MQPENKNDSVQFPTRYWAYDLAKRHLGGFGGRQVFPIGSGDGQDIQQSRRKGDYTTTIKTKQGAMQNDSTFIRTDEQDSQKRWDKSNNPNSIRRTSYTDGMRIRRLTPTECERLMGLPDGWTEGVSDTQRYKLCGNGVVVNVVEEIIKRLILGNK